MTAPSDIRYAKIPLNNKSDSMPAVGFGTLIPDPVKTKEATKTALETGFRGRIQENFDISALPEDAMQEIRDMETRIRFNSVVETGVPGFIPRVK